MNSLLQFLLRWDGNFGEVGSWHSIWKRSPFHVLKNGWNFSGEMFLYYVKCWFLLSALFEARTRAKMPRLDFDTLFNSEVRCLLMPTRDQYIFVFFLAAVRRNGLMWQETIYSRLTFVLNIVSLIVFIIFDR